MSPSNDLVIFFFVFFFILLLRHISLFQKNVYRLVRKFLHNCEILIIQKWIFRFKVIRFLNWISIVTRDLTVTYFAEAFFFLILSFFCHKNCISFFFNHVSAGTFVVKIPFDVQFYLFLFFFFFINTFSFTKLFEIYFALKMSMLMWQRKSKQFHT